MDRARLFLKRGLLALGLLIVPTLLLAQGPYAAQIQQALQGFVQQVHTWTAPQSISASITAPATVESFVSNILGTVSLTADTTGTYYGQSVGIVSAPDSTFDFTTHGLSSAYFYAYHQGAGTVDNMTGFVADVEVFDSGGGAGAVTQQALGMSTYMYFEGNAAAVTGAAITIDDSGSNLGVVRGLRIDDLSALTGSSIQAVNYADKFIVDASSNVFIDSLKTTGSAGSKKVVCVDTATGRLYASSTGTDCSN